MDRRDFLQSRRWSPRPVQPSLRLRASAGSSTRPDGLQDAAVRLKGAWSLVKSYPSNPTSAEIFVITGAQLAPSLPRRAGQSHMPLPRSFATRVPLAPPPLEKGRSPSPAFSRARRVGIHKLPQAMRICVRDSDPHPARKSAPTSPFQGEVEPAARSRRSPASLRVGRM
jgi:hypothetical protein